MGAQEPALDQGGDPVDRREQLVGIVPSSQRGPLAVPVVEVAELFDSVVALGVGARKQVFVAALAIVTAEGA